MAGGASAFGMIRSLKNNKELLSKKSRFKKECGIEAIKKDYTKGESGQLYFKSPTKVDLLSNRREILKERRRDRLVMFGLFFALMVGVVAGTFYLVNMKAPKISPVLRPKLDPPAPSVAEQYIYFMSAGDEWINEKKWHNAVFEYKKALEFVPSDFKAQYRLALAYAQWCTEEGEQCAAFFGLINPLIEAHPDEPQLYKVRSAVYERLGDTEKAAEDLASIKAISRKKL